MSPPTMRRTASLVAVAILLITGGCGKEPAPDVAVPQLETTLSRVDASIAGRDWERARRAVQKLVSQTGAAREAGALTQQQADRIQAAAARLLSALPDPPPQSPSPLPAPTGREPTPDNAEEAEEEQKEKLKEDAEERRENREDDEDEDDEQRD